MEIEFGVRKLECTGKIFNGVYKGKLLAFIFQVHYRTGHCLSKKQ